MVLNCSLVLGVSVHYALPQLPISSRVSPRACPRVARILVFSPARQHKYGFLFAAVLGFIRRTHAPPPGTFIRARLCSLAETRSGRCTLDHAIGLSPSRLSFATDYFAPSSSETAPHFVMLFKRWSTKKRNLKLRAFFP